MKLASIERIKAIEPHYNADSLELAKVLGYTAIVRKGDFQPGNLCVFVQPDTVLGDQPWTVDFKKRSSRVKACRIRSVWSEGLVLRPDEVGLFHVPDEGTEVSGLLKITKYEPPVPQDLSAKGLLPFGIPPTDEERINNIESGAIPWGELVDVTLKIDGQSASFYRSHVRDSGLQYGVCGRRLEYKLDCTNNYTVNEKRHSVLQKLASLDLTESICLRGEQFGQGIQSGAHNPHSKLPLGLAFFSVYLINEHRYAHKGEKFYAYDFIPTLGLPTAPMIEKDVVLTPELVAKYAEGKEINGQPYEGVVIQHSKGSFKILSKIYDSLK